jgi:hypothetical protein
VILRVAIALLAGTVAGSLLGAWWYANRIRSSALDPEWLMIPNGRYVAPLSAGIIVQPPYCLGRWPVKVMAAQRRSRGAQLHQLERLSLPLDAKGTVSHPKDF